LPVSETEGKDASEHRQLEATRKRESGHSVQVTLVPKHVLQLASHSLHVALPVGT